MLTFSFIFLIVLKPIEVWIITLSNTSKIAGITQITINIEISAPLDIKLHNDAIIFNLEIIPTPNVAAKNDIPETKIEPAELLIALSIALILSIPFFLFSKYFVVSKIA